MLTFNRPKLISRSIESVIDQDFPDWELLVVHDGPDTETVDVMNAWEQREPRIRYFRRGVKGNIAEATNFGLKHAKGEFVAILDDDDVWIDTAKLTRQVRFLESHPECVACGGGLVVVGPDGEEKMRYLKPLSNAEIRRSCLYANPIAHSVSLYRRESALKVGGYDESLAGFQDWDLWLKLGQLGGLANFDDYLGTYLIWEGGGSFFQRRRNTESGLRIVWRHRSGYPGFPLALTIATLYYLYARLPDVLTKSTFPALSRLKKRLTAKRE